MRRQKLEGRWAGFSHPNWDIPGSSHVALAVKNPPAKAGDVRHRSSIPGQGSSLGGGHGSRLQYSCLENPLDGGAWWAIVRGAAQSRTQLWWLTHTRPIIPGPVKDETSQGVGRGLVTGKSSSSRDSLVARVPGRVSGWQRCPGPVEVCDLGHVAADLRLAASHGSLLCCVAFLYSWLPPPHGFCFLLAVASSWPLSPFCLYSECLSGDFPFLEKEGWLAGQFSHLLRHHPYMGMAFLEAGQVGQVSEQNRFLSKAVG